MNLLIDPWDLMDGLKNNYAICKMEETKRLFNFFKKMG
jgi:hypothetical protein